jgi:hypothetical protein
VEDDHNEVAAFIEYSRNIEEDFLKELWYLSGLLFLSPCLRHFILVLRKV